MALKPLSQLPDWQLDDANKDIRGWPVKDAAGQEVGRVKELMVNTDDQTVSSAKLDNGKEIPLRDLDQRDGFVQERPAVSSAAGNVGATASQAFYGDNAGQPANQMSNQTMSNQTKEMAMNQDTSRPGMSGTTGNQSMEQGTGQAGEMATGRAGQATTGLGQGGQDMGQSAGGSAMSGQEGAPDMVSIEEEVIVVTPYEQLEPRFREHHQKTFADKGPYEAYEPAYRHGHALAASPEHRGKAWEDVKPHARRAWEERNPGMPYEDYEEAIGEGYAAVGGL